MEKIKIEEELLEMLRHPNENIEVTEDNFFKITKDLVEKIESVIDEIDSIPEEVIKGMSSEEKLELTTIINNAERVLKQGIVVEEW